jgi:uncharacterized membrane protein YcaP (DUF421 family)
MNWVGIWVPQLSPMEVIFRAAVIFVFIHISFRLLGRKEWTRYSGFNVAILFLIAVALRTTLVADDTSLTSGIISLSTILILDWAFSYASFRSSRLSDLLNGPTLPLVKNGVIDDRQMRRSRISRELLFSMLRLRGCWRLQDVEAYLEPNGHISFKLRSSYAQPADQQSNSA